MGPSKRVNPLPALVCIGADACLCSNVAELLGATTIGEGAVMAAGAVAAKGVPARTVVGGVPAKVIKKL